jgi:predicted HTH domain antitoxin
MNLVLPDDIMQAAQITEDELRWEIAVIFLQRRKITLEQASRLVGMSQSDLLQVLTDRLINTPYNADDVQRVVDTWRKQGW